MVILYDVLCPSSETTIWILYHPSPSLLSSLHLLDPEDITLTFQLLLTNWCVRVWLDWWIAPHALLLMCYKETCRTKGCAFWWLRESQCWWRTCTSEESCACIRVWSSTTFCWRDLLTPLSNKQERAEGNTLKSKLANMCVTSVFKYCWLWLIY